MWCPCSYWPITSLWSKARMWISLVIWLNPSPWNRFEGGGFRCNYSTPDFYSRNTIKRPHLSSSLHGSTGLHLQTDLSYARCRGVWLQGHRKETQFVGNTHRKRDNLEQSQGLFSLETKTRERPTHLRGKGTDISLEDWGYASRILPPVTHSTTNEIGVD